MGVTVALPMSMDLALVHADSSGGSMSFGLLHIVSGGLGGRVAIAIAIAIAIVWTWIVGLGLAIVGLGFGVDGC